MAGTVFDLQGKISIDASQFYSTMQNVMSSVENFRRSVSGISTTISSVQSGFRTLSSSVGSTDAQFRDLQKALEQAQQATASARQNVLSLTAAYEASKNATGADSEQTKALARELEKAREKLRECEQAERNASKELEEYSRTTHTASNNSNNLSDSVTNAGNAAAGAGKQFSSFGDILKANILSEVIISGIETVIGKIKELGDAAVNAVTEFTKTSVQVGMTFDSAMSQVAATMGMTMEEMSNQVGEVDLAWGHFSGNLREYAQVMGENTAFSATDAARALNYMALAGYKTQDAMEMLPNVLNLASAGAMDLGAAANMVTKSKNALGIDSFERVTQLMNEMAATASNSGTYVSQLGDAILSIGATARTMKGGFVTMEDGTRVAYDGVTELNAALGLLADSGTTAAEGGTALRNILNSFRSDKFKKVFGAAGVNAYDEATGQLRSLKDIFKDMNAVMAGMTDAERDDMIGDVFNKFDLAKVNSLLATSQERWNSLTATIAGARDAAGQMAKTQMDNLTGDITLFNSALEGIHIAFADRINPELRKFVELGTEQVSKITTAFKEGGFTGALDKIGWYITQWKQLISDEISSIINSDEFSKTFDKLGFMITNSLLKTARDLPKRIQFISTLFEQGLDIITENLPDFTKVSVAIIESLSKAITGVVKSDSLSKFVSGTVTAMQKIVPALATGISSVIGALASRFGEFANIVIPALVDVFVVSVNALAENITPVVNALVSTIPTVVNAVVSNIEPLVRAVGTVFTALIDGITADDGTLDAIVNGFSSIVDSLVENIDPILLALQDVTIQIMDKLVEPETLGKISESVGTVFGKAISGAAKILGSGTGFVIELTQAIVQLTLRINWDEVAQSILGEFGKCIIGGLTGLDMTEWDSYWEGIGADTYDAVQDIIKSLKEAADFWNGLWEGVGGMFYDETEEIKKNFQNFVDAAYQWGHDLIQNFIDGVADKGNEWNDMWENVGATIYDYLHHSHPEKGYLADDYKWMPDMIDSMVEGIQQNSAKFEKAIFDMTDVQLPEKISAPEVDTTNIMNFLYGLQNLEIPGYQVDLSGFNIPSVGVDVPDVSGMKIPDMNIGAPDVAEIQVDASALERVVKELAALEIPGIEVADFKTPDFSGMELPTLKTEAPSIRMPEVSVNTARFDGAVAELNAVDRNESKAQKNESSAWNTPAASASSGGVTVNFTQNNTSPQALDPYEVWRQNKKAIELMKLQLQGV